MLAFKQTAELAAFCHTVAVLLLTVWLWATEAIKAKLPTKVKNKTKT